MYPRIYIPENLKLRDLLLTKRDNEWVRQNIYRYFFIISTIYFRRVTNKSYSRDSYVSINYKELRSFVSQRKARVFLDDLINLGVIECDNRYINGSKSLGYRLTEKYRHTKARAFPNIDKHIITRVAKKAQDLETRINNEQPHIKQLFHCLKRIQLDFDSARETLSNYYEESAFEKERSKIAIDLIEYKKWHFIRDNFGGRLHTNLTTLPKILRRHILVNNLFTDQPISLTELDIKTSQPLFFLAYIREQNEYEIPDKEVEKYANVVYSGFYSYFMDKIDESDREKVKKGVFKWLFYKRNHTNLITKYEKAFNEDFPNIFAMIKSIKSEHGGNYLAYLLQKKEADLIIDEIVKVYAQLHPIDFVGTIHDSIILDSKHAQQFKVIMEEKLSTLVGFKPTIHMNEINPK